MNGMFVRERYSGEYEYRRIVYFLALLETLKCYKGHFNGTLNMQRWFFENKAEQI